MLKYTYSTLLIIVILIGELFLPTFGIEYFPWGSANVDGLFLLLLPLVLIPVFLIDTVVNIVAKNRNLVLCRIRDLSILLVYLYLNKIYPLYFSFGAAFIVLLVLIILNIADYFRYKKGQSV